VLDLGCGTGVLSEQMLLGGKRVMAMDLSRDMIARARERLRGYPPQRRGTLRGDCEKLPFADGRFDHAICLGVISFLAGDDHVLDELRRVVRTGGTLVLAVRNRYPLGKALDPVKLAGRLWRALGRPGAAWLGREATTPEPETPRFYHVESLVVTLRRHGFEVFEEKRIGYGPLTIADRPVLPLPAQIWLSNVVDRVASRPGLRGLPTRADLCILAARAL
jgi:ubiquinone/menaquinone biosynthesis C-methylase UbiE